MTEFAHSYALVIGINDYAGGISPLRSAVPDARAVADVLAREHGYTLRIGSPVADAGLLLLDADASRARIEAAFRLLAAGLRADDRLLVYFAGHGIAETSPDGSGPAGFLVPHGARAGESETYLPMTRLHEALAGLPCRHLLLVLDCCFAGAFRWSTTRSFDPSPRPLYRRRYARFLADPAWQVLTSAAFDQRALDVGGLERNRREGDGPGHSPFAAALLDALRRGSADLSGAGGRRDGVMTATELYLHLRDAVEPRTEISGTAQTPGLWQLQRHGRGEFLFRVPGVPLALQEDPPLNPAANPWRDGGPYAESDAPIFAGRERDLARATAALARPGLLLLGGDSGSGKTSLLRAGILPWVRSRADAGQPWTLLDPLDPSDASEAALGAAAARLTAAPPQRPALLVLDPLDALFAPGFSPETRRRVLARLGLLLRAEAARLRLLLVGRPEHLAALNNGPLAAQLADASRVELEPLGSAELRRVIEGPAHARVLYFEPPEWVDELLDAVVGEPGGLPLLSATLSELYLRVFARGGLHEDRALPRAELLALGGLPGVARARAAALVEEAAQPEEREALRQVLLRLVELEDGQRTRHPASLAELDFSDPEVLEPPAHDPTRAALDRLVARRLVRRFGAPARVELAHRALLAGWEPLEAWIAADPAAAALRLVLWRAVLAWEERGRAEGALWDGHPHLDRVVERADLNRAERRFVNASLTRQLREERWRVFLTLLLVERAERSLEQRDPLGAELYIAEALARSPAPPEHWRNLLRAARAQGATREGPRVRPPEKPRVATSRPCLSPDGRWVADEVAHGHLRIWNAETGAVLHELPGHRIRTRALAQGRGFVVGCGDDGALRVWLPELSKMRGEEVVRWEEAPVRCVAGDAFHSGDRFLAGRADGGLVLFEMEESRPQRALRQLAERRDVHPGGVTALGLHLRRGLLASTGADRVLRVWKDRLSDEAERVALDFEPRALAWSPEGDRLALCGPGRVWVYQLSSRLGTVLAETGAWEALAWSPSARELAAIDGQARVRCWELAPGHAARELPGAGPLRAVAWSRRGALAAIGDAGRLHLWNTARDAPVLVDLGEPGRALAWSEQGETLAVGGDARRVTLWEHARGRLDLSESLPHDPTWVEELAWSPDATRLASSGRDAALRLWDRTSGAELHVLRGRDGPHRCLTWSGDGAALAALEGGSRVRCWDPVAGAARPPPDGLDGEAQLLALGPSAAELALVRPDGDLRAHGLEGGPNLQGARGLAYSPRGELLAWGSREVWEFRPARAEDSATPVLLPAEATVEAPPLRASAELFCWSPDGTWFARAFESAIELSRWAGERQREAFLRGLWPVRSLATRGEFLFALDDAGVQSWRRGGREHSTVRLPRDVFAAAFSADGAFLAVAGDEMLLLLDPRDGSVIAEASPGIGDPRALAFAPEGGVLAVLSATRVHLWEPAQSRLRELAPPPPRSPGGPGLDALLGFPPPRGPLPRVARAPLAFSADGRWLAASRAGRTELYARDTGQAREVPGAEGALALAFHPEGHELAVSHAGGVETWPLPDLGRPTWLRERRLNPMAAMVQPEDPFVLDLGWSPRPPFRLTFASPPDRLVVNDGGGVLPRIGPAEFFPADAFRWLPDGRLVALTDHGELRVWSEELVLQHALTLPQFDGAWALDPRARRLAVADSDAGIRIWDLHRAAALESASPAQLLADAQRASGLELDMAQATVRTRRDER